MREHDTEERIHGISYRRTNKSSKNVLSERIPFHSVCRLILIHLKEDFAARIRPSDDGAFVARSSQLGPVHLHTELTTT